MFLRMRSHGFHHLATNLGNMFLKFWKDHQIKQNGKFQDFFFTLIFGEMNPILTNLFFSAEWGLFKLKPTTFPCFYWRKGPVKLGRTWMLYVVEKSNLRMGHRLFFKDGASIIPWGSMYGVFTYIWLMFTVNVGKYTIHGSSGIE